MLLVSLFVVLAEYCIILHATDPVPKTNVNADTTSNTLANQKRGKSEENLNVQHDASGGDNRDEKLEDAKSKTNFENLRSLYGYDHAYFETSVNLGGAEKEDKKINEQIGNLYGTFKEKYVLPIAPDNLRYAFIIFRHGIRSPMHFPFQTIWAFQKMWGFGIGLLTKRGRRLMHHVGESLGTRYNKLVPHFDKNVVQFSSSKVGRARKSAKCVATGMFGPNDPVFTDKDSLTLAPCKNLPGVEVGNFDKCDLFADVDLKWLNQCNMYTRLRKQSQQREKQEVSPQRKVFYNLLNECIHNSYQIPGFARKLYHSAKAFDTFQSWILNKKEALKECVAHAMPVMQKAVQLHLWYEIHGKTNMVEYYIGLLVNTILTEMSNGLQKDPTQSRQNLEDPENGHTESKFGERRLKMHFHGSHDVTVSPLFWVLSQDETYYALTGDTLIVEMTSDYTVQVFLFSPLTLGKGEKFRQISLKPLCGKEDCKYEEFEKALTKFSYDEPTWNSKCKDDAKLTSDDRPLPHDINDEDLQIMQRPVTN
ncbi:uncharacterized protein LOC129004053 [Macrosteles quadrilineatus]|uniref:uncharacterized protein LOC129004053 n=1 Tax=Macrosteles quadrilineatus TaxID=74068 RepID=UPI0023E2BC1C|nr:uncharacterized protein LOC129004053 [Macrosteles quadrilineatus]